MRSNKKAELSFIILLLSVFPIIGQPLNEYLKKDYEKLMKININLVEFDIKGVVAEELKTTDFAFKILSEKTDSLVGYCFAGSAPGRFESFDYYVIYDVSTRVDLVKVWKYRSTHGGAVAGKRWLKQFRGYKGGELKYGRDIQAISGATISGNSMVDEIQRAQKIMENLVGKGLD